MRKQNHKYKATPPACPNSVVPSSEHCNEHHFRRTSLQWYTSVSCQLSIQVYTTIQLDDKNCFPHPVKEQ